MRAAPLIVLGLLLAATSFAPAQEQDTARETAQPRGERWNERWQGRQHWLYEEAVHDTGADGYDANAQARCRNVPMRVLRSDGAYAIRWINRCD